MGFQKEVTDRLGVSVPGTVVQNANSMMSKAMVTEDATCKIGGFVRMGTGEGLAKGANGSNEAVGIVISDRYLTGNSQGQAIAANQEIQVAIKNCVVAIANMSGDTATEGQGVYVVSASGTVKFSSEPITASATFTGWTVKEGAADGGIVYVMK